MMMQKMLVDLTFFIWLVAIFLIGYGVSTTAILNPNKQKNYTSELVSFQNQIEFKFKFKSRNFDIQKFQIIILFLNYCSYSMVLLRYFYA